MSLTFRRVFGQPLDGEPMRAGGECFARELARVDPAIVLDQHNRLDGQTSLRCVDVTQLLQMCDEVAARLGQAGMDP